MSEPWNERAIAAAISRQTLNRRCVLLVDRCNWTGHECDVLGVTTDLRIIDVEIKISRSDLKADANKRKWWRSQPWFQHRQSRPEPTLREHPPRVWKHYYAMPREIWSDEMLPDLASPASGVLLLDRLKDNPHAVSIECVRRAKPAKDAYRLTPEQAIDIARLANMRMWNAYEAVDRMRSNP